MGNIRKIKNLPRATLVVLIAGFVLIAASMALFIELGEDILEKEKFTIDSTIQRVTEGFNDSLLYTVMEYTTEAGSVLFVTCATTLLFIYLLFFSKKSKWIGIFLAVTMLGISGLTKLLKLFFERERPELLQQYDGTGFSFPSGHSTGSITFYGFIIYLIAASNLRRGLKISLIALFSLLIISIAFSRVVLSVHYFTDIIAGLALGLSWLITCIFALKLMIYREKRRRKS